jgi:hypothetical protein
VSARTRGSWRERLRSGLGTARALGPFSTLLYALDRGLARLGPAASLRRYYLVAQPVPPGPQLPAHRGASITVREVGPGDPALHVFPRPAEEIRRRFAAGAIGLVAFRAGRPIGWIWLLQGAYTEPVDRCRIEPRPPETTAWDFDLEVVPEERQGLAFARLWEAAWERLRARGVQWTFSRVSAYNPASLAAHRRLGARPLHGLLFLALGRVQLMTATTPPYLHLSLRADRIPQLRLQAPEQ